MKNNPGTQTKPGTDTNSGTQTKPGTETNPDNTGSNVQQPDTSGNYENSWPDTTTDPDDPENFTNDDLNPEDIDTSDEEDPDEEENFYNVEWNVSSIVLQLGKSTAKVIAEASDDDDIKEYITSDESIAAVNEDGAITAKGIGKAVIRVISEHDCFADLTVKVQKKAVTTKKLTVASKDVTLEEGETFNLKAERTPITSSKRITYKSRKI